MAKTTAEKTAAEAERAAEAPRLRFVDTVVARERGSNLRIRVRLERDGRAYDAETAGVGLETVEVRLAADATLAAIREAHPDSPTFQLIGIKTVRAFDADVVLLALLDPTEERRLIGAVAVERTLAEAAARAVLDATNRILCRPGAEETPADAAGGGPPPA